MNKELIINSDKPNKFNFLESFSLKIVKILEEQAFLNKVKIINAIVPEKVKLYIEINLDKEDLNNFEDNIIKTANGIKHGKFSGIKGMHCEWCDFRSLICPLFE